MVCPHCGSTQLSANKKGFSAGKATAGFLLTGGVGLLAGAIGSNKVKITCLNCGCSFVAGNYGKEKQKYDDLQKNINEPLSFGMICTFTIIAIICGTISYNLFSNDWNFFGFIFLVIALFFSLGVIVGIFASFFGSKKAQAQDIEKTEFDLFPEEKYDINIINDIDSSLPAGEYDVCLSFKEIFKGKYYLTNIRMKDTDELIGEFHLQGNVHLFDNKQEIPTKLFIKSEPDKGLPKYAYVYTEK